MYYPNTKLIGYAGLGLVTCLMSIICNFKYCQYKLRTSDFNVIALKKFNECKKLQDILGPPIKAGYVFSNKKNGITENEVDIVVLLQGQKLQGLLKYQANKIQNNWIINKMEFSFSDKAGGIVQLIKPVNESSINK